MTTVSKKFLKSAIHIMDGKTLILGAIISTLLVLPANSEQIGNGKTFFEQSPRIIRATNTQPSPGAYGEYQFSISVPKDAGEALEAVTIIQHDSLERISFKVNKSYAFAGSSRNGGVSIPLANIGGEQTSDKEVTLVFDPPVAPGKTVTVVLSGVNPNLSGIYEFDVIAYPVGQNSPGLALGTVRINSLSR